LAYSKYRKILKIKTATNSGGQFVPASGGQFGMCGMTTSPQFGSAHPDHSAKPGINLKG
jgi:hypothetical protein